MIYDIFVSLALGVMYCCWAWVMKDIVEHLDIWRR